jgi:hypothetical protein
MEIQNISGATDVISRDFSVNTNISNENSIAKEVQEKPAAAEENKGKNVDVKA